jgi:hypothetical protein
MVVVPSGAGDSPHTGRRVLPPSPPHRRMVAGFFPTPNVFINVAIQYAAFYFWANEKVVYTQTCITRKCISKIIPECINLFIRKKLSDAICPSLCDQLLKFVSDFGPEQGIIHPAFGFVNIQLGWHNIIVTGQYYRHVLSQ